MNELPLSPKQVESLRESATRVSIWSGAIRSGKTIASLLRWLIYVASAPRGGQLVVVGRTRDSIARNVFAPLTDPSLFGPVADQVHYTAGAPTARILDRTVYVLGASDAKAEKVLRGVTVAGAYVDELTVIAEDFFTQLLGRMSVPGAQCFRTTNPDSPAHWVKRRYLDRLAELPDWRSFVFVLDDNPALEQTYKDSIRREYTGLWFRRFVLGEWVAAEGAVFDARRRVGCGRRPRALPRRFWPARPHRCRWWPGRRGKGLVLDDDDVRGVSTGMVATMWMPWPVGLWMVRGRRRW